MGRRIPADETNLLIHPLLSISFFAAGMAATIAMITALCSFTRKRSPPPSQAPANTTTEIDAEPATMAAAGTTTTTPQQDSETDQENEDGRESKELPLPPRMRHSGQIDSTINNKAHMKKSASERRLLSNLSMKLPRSLSMARKDKVKGGPEESIWMKTIILGEKCKVPDEDEVAIYDAKGRKIPAYRPKSRQSSFIDPSAIPDQRMRKVEIENKINQERDHKQENKNQESDQE
ncbi:hypothetical protein GBA52_001670 [Prunus armeniaca]|nr:hypothetical protein GBA52_001670 [Prunus armeniaca]